MSLNKWIGTGRTTREVELRYTQQGTPVANLSLAVDRDFKNADGSKSTDFIEVVLWKKVAEIAAKHVGKGSLILIEGRLQLSKFEDSNNIKRTKAEIVASKLEFLNLKDPTGGQPQDQQQQQQQQMPPQNQQMQQQPQQNFQQQPQQNFQQQPQQNFQQQPQQNFQQQPQQGTGYAPPNQTGQLPNWGEGSMPAF